MKRFISKIIVIALLIFVLDRVVGYVMYKVIDSIEIGGMGRDNYICNEAEEDILVFGSSRAVHHYNSTILEDSLGLSCYNCGDDGNGIILSYGRLLMCRERKQPKIIICDLCGFDYEKDDNSKYLGWLKSRYDRPGIAAIFESVSPREKYKMLSYMYRFNTRFLQNLMVCLTHKSSDTGIKGFRPLDGEMDGLKIKKNREVKPVEFDTLKLNYINKFIDAAEGSKLIFVCSPSWYGASGNDISTVTDIFKKRNILFLNYLDDPKYVHQDKYFKDGTHLNARGADEFTKDLIQRLKNEYHIDSLVSQ